MLKFLGSGGAFNQKRGNNSAYLELGTELFLFDVGENVLEKLVHLQLLEKKTRVNIFITHLHGDHVGGLGTLIFYLYYKVFEQNKNKINVFFPSESIVEYLALQGVLSNYYTFYINRWDDLIIDGYEKTMEYIFEETIHDENLNYKGKVNTFSVEMNLKDSYSFYYSGDTSEYKTRLKNLWNFDYVYHEVTSNNGVTVHLSYDKLLEDTKYFSLKDKKKIILMHLDTDFDVERALKDGFNVAENVELNE